MIKNPNKYRLLRVFEYMLQTDEMLRRYRTSLLRMDFVISCQIVNLFYVIWHVLMIVAMKSRFVKIIIAANI